LAASVWVRGIDLGFDLVVLDVDAGTAASFLSLEGSAGKQ
jgi:hypothetical protein